MSSRYKVITIILVVYLVVFFLIYGLTNMKNGQRELTLLVGDNTVWNYSNKSWLNITREETLDLLNWQEYKVFLDN